MPTWIWDRCCTVIVSISACMVYLLLNIWYIKNPFMDTCVILCKCGTNIMNALLSAPFFHIWHRILCFTTECLKSKPIIIIGTLCYISTGVSCPLFFDCLSSPAQLDVSVGTAELTTPPELCCLRGICHVHWRVKNCSTRCSQMWPVSLISLLFHQELPESLKSCT